MRFSLKRWHQQAGNNKCPICRRGGRFSSIQLFGIFADQQGRQHASPRKGKRRVVPTTVLVQSVDDDDDDDADGNQKGGGKATLPCPEARRWHARYEDLVKRREEERTAAAKTRDALLAATRQVQELDEAKEALQRQLDAKREEVVNVTRTQVNAMSDMDVQLTLL